MKGLADIFRRPKPDGTVKQARRPDEEQGQPYRLAVWMLVMSLAANAAQMVAVVILSASLVVMSHRENLRPFFVTSDVAENRVFRVEPLYGNIKAFDLVTMTLARRYVKLRETLDFATEETRWTEASWLASAEVSESFVKIMKAKDSPLTLFKQRQRKREIEIVSSPLVANNGGTRRTHLVEFRTIDSEPNKAKEIKVYQVTVVTEARDADIKFNDALLNPYGVTVIHYSDPQEKRE